MRARLKRILIWLYCRGLLPRRVVDWLFRLFRLKGA